MNCVERVGGVVDGQQRLGFFCPACNEKHYVTVIVAAKHSGERPFWYWNQSLTTPTFSPYIVFNKNGYDSTRPICHFYIDYGKIRFLDDSTHDLAGQTVELPDLD